MALALENRQCAICTKIQSWVTYKKMAHNRKFRTTGDQYNLHL